jgi:hypothetical protein
MSTLTVNLLNPKARYILQGLEDAGLIELGGEDENIEDTERASEILTLLDRRNEQEQTISAEEILEKLRKRFAM